MFIQLKQHQYLGRKQNIQRECGVAIERCSRD
jgi:hypothetical protein